MVCAEYMLFNASLQSDKLICSRMLDQMPDMGKRYFLTVLIADKYLQSSLVSNDAQGVLIKEFSEVKTYFDRRDLLEQLDKSLQQLGPDSQDIVETVFAFDHDWLQDGELSDDKKPIVKQISEDLSLDAIGQISIPEALAEARLIGDQADSCLLFVFKEDSFDLIFLKHGQFLDLITVGRSGNVVDDFAEVLARAGKHLGEDGKYFPSKVLLTSIALKQKELESLQQQLSKVDWSTNPGFTQPPSIVALEPDYMIKSASLSTGKVLSKDGLMSKMPKRELVSETTINEIAVEVPIAKQASSTVNSASSFGIDFDQNYFAKEANVSRPIDLIPTQAPTSHQVHHGQIHNNKINDNKKRSRFGKFYAMHQKMILIGAGAGLFVLLLLASIFAFLISKVKLILIPQQTLLQKSVTITLDPNIAESDFSKALLKASLQNKEIDGEDVLETTGIGLVGDKAKGKVTIYNKTAEETELTSGTLLSSNGIEFLLDSTVKVSASVTKADGSGVDFGKVETTVTAKDIGSEANYNKDTKFRVAEYFDDKFSAISADNFSGGSSREVRVVAQADQDKLLANLTKKLLEVANQELEQESKNGAHLVATGKTKAKNSNFSAKLGDEAESISLKLVLEVEVVKYLSADLKKLGLALLEKDLPTGYSFVDADPSLMSDKAQVASDSSKIKLNADLSAKAMANLDLAQLKQQVLGKNWLDAEEELESNSEIKQVQVIFNPPFLINMMRKLPSDESRVILELGN